MVAASGSINQFISDKITANSREIVIFCGTTALGAWLGGIPFAVAPTIYVISRKFTDKRNAIILTGAALSGFMIAGKIGAVAFPLFLGIGKIFTSSFFKSPEYLTRELNVARREVFNTPKDLGHLAYRNNL